MKRFALTACVLAASAQAQVVDTGQQAYVLAGFIGEPGAFQLDFALPPALTLRDEFGRPAFQFSVWVSESGDPYRSYNDCVYFKTCGDVMRAVSDGASLIVEGKGALNFSYDGRTLSFNVPWQTYSFALETYSYGSITQHFDHGVSGVAYRNEVTPVPEPATWALMLGGLAYAGIRRRWTA